MTPNLPPAVAHLIATANANDTNAFLDCFTANGTVDDWGREFTGSDAIRAWSDGEFIGVQVRLDITSVEETPDGTTVTAQIRA